MGSSDPVPYMPKIRIDNFSLVFPYPLPDQSAVLTDAPQ